MSKNIEKIKGEDVLSEIVDITLDDAKLNGLVSNDVSDMYQSASGLKPLKPIDTYESPIVELKANLKLIFRRLFSVPLTILGSNKTNKPISIISMIEQMFNHYRERLKGSDEYGIPSRLSSLTDLPDAPALLADRKIGEPNAIDGISLLHQMSESSVELTKIEDTNRGWTLDKSYSLERLIALFPALTEIIYGCKYITKSLTDTRSAYKLPEKLSFNGLEECVSVPLIAKGEGAFTGNKEMSFPALKRMGCLFSYIGNGWWTSSISTDTLRFDALEEITSAGGGRGAFIEVPCPNLKKLDLSHVKSMGRPLYGGSCLQGLEELDLSGTNNVNLCHGIYPANISTALLLLKIKEGFAANLNLQYWSPTLDSSNLQQFLSNFKTYILLRLAPMTSGTTKNLTLSAEVYRAIYGLDSSDVADPTSAARTLTLADLGVTELTDIEIAAGITLDTLYYSAIDTYRGAIYWNIAK